LACLVILSGGLDRAEAGVVGNDSSSEGEGPDCTASYLRRELASNAERCEYVKDSCPSDGILEYYKIYYCSIIGTGEETSGVVRQVAFFVGLGVGLVVLFRVLGTTADDYFAPTLTELCREMGLPPRFAGVTFLALASGAPDVSSTFAAIRGGNYSLSLGALSGAAIFVTCFVSGSVVLVGNGAKARGALCRDVIMLMSTICMVLYIFVRGKIDKSQAIFFVILYFAFAAIVLIADLWHRRKVIIPAVTEGSRMMVRRLSTMGRGSVALEKSLVDDMGAVLIEERDGLGEGGRMEPAERPRRPSETELVEQGAMSTESDTETDSDEEDGEWKHQNRLYKQQMYKAIEREGEEGDGSVGGDEEDLARDTYLPLVDGREVLLEPLSDKAVISPKEFFFQFYHKSHESIHAILYKMRHEGWAFFKEENFVSKVLIILEIPFTIARTLTIPAVDGEMYFKPFFVASCTGLPFWVLYNTCAGGKLSRANWIAVVLTAMASTFLGMSTLLYAPAKNPPMLKFGTKFPFGLAVICLVSFVLAALWIDLIATELVSVITFVGSITAIDQSILGLTVIAWGNSIGDYSSNLAMAKRGLGNVSMTASFAGPVFNILVGLGFGFIFYFNLNGVYEKEVGIPTATALAFCCIVLNALGMLAAGVLNNFHIPRRYGYVPIAVYGVYLVAASILVATKTELPYLT